MKKIFWILIGLVLLLAILVCIDILTGIWYWNRLNLKFDSQEFNNICSPLAGIISGLLMFFTVLLSQRQNKINLSLGIKPYFEKEVDKLVKEGDETPVDLKFRDLIDTNDPFNCINYTRLLDKLLRELYLSKEFKEDFMSNPSMQIYESREYYLSREYKEILLSLTEFYVGSNPVLNFNAKIKRLIREINNSTNLITEDKSILIKRIKEDLIQNYISKIKVEKQSPDLIPKIPILYDPRKPGQVSFKLISETEFGDLYNWLEENKLL